nr:hypothetical protein [Tanacetum cinerariifolium]
MSRDVLIVGSTMRIPLIFQGEYSQWSESVNAGATSSEQPSLKDKSMWSDQEKKIRKIDRLARSLLIQGLPNDIYSLIDCNKTAKDLWDALERHMLGSEYGEQDSKAAKQYATMMRQNKNLLNININDLYNIFKQNQGDVNDAMKSKKKAAVIISDPLALVVEQTKVSKIKEKVVVSSKTEGSNNELKKIIALLAKAFNQKKLYSKQTNNNLRTSSTTSSVKKTHESMNKKAKVKDYEYYKTNMLLAKKDKDKQVLLAEDHAWMESSSDFDQEINANMVFMTQMEKVLSYFEKSSSSSDDTITEWKPRIKRYIDTKPNHELNHYCLEYHPYKLDWKDVEIPVSEGSPITTTARIRETYKNVSQDIRDQLNVEAEAV